jgi:transcriptional regulator with XRE-family HTH domain
MATRSVDIGPFGHQVRERVQHIRRAQNKSLGDVSRALTALPEPHPLSVSTLSQIENGGRRIDVDDLHALAAVLEVPIVDLLQDPKHPLAGLIDVSAEEFAALKAKVAAIESAQAIYDKTVGPAQAWVDKIVGPMQAFADNYVNSGQRAKNLALLAEQGEDGNGDR